MEKTACKNECSFCISSLDRVKDNVLQYRLPKGKHQGKTFDEIFEQEPDYINNLIREFAPMVRFAKLYLEYRVEMAKEAIQGVFGF